MLPGERLVLTTCVWCGTGCQFYLRVRDNRLVGVVPSRSHPISRGRLCLKGWKSFQFVHHPDRLKYPMIRNSKGQLERVSWEEALDYVAGRLMEIKRKYGPEAIAVFGSAKCTNEDNYVLVRFARATIGTDHVDHCARLCHASTVAGLARSFGSGAMTNSIDEIEDAEVILITGSNTSEQHPVIASHMMRALNRGARLIVVDPRRIPMARIAHIHLSHRPGTDIAWINGFINVIVNEGLADMDFVRNHTTGFEEMWEVAKEYTPDVVESITGIPKEDLIRAARMYASAEKAMIFYAMGITQHVTGTHNVFALANLAMVTGHIGKPSTGVNPLRGQNNVQGASDLAVVPGKLPGYQDPTDPEVRRKFARVWGVEPPAWKGFASTQVSDAIMDGTVKAVYIMGENPVRSHPDIRHIEEAFENLEFLVVQDIFPTETTKFAHVVLPATAWGEKDGTFTNTDRRVQRVRRAVAPPAEARDDWWIIQEVARRMGDDYGFENPSQIFDEMASLMPIYSGISYDRIEREGIPWPCPSPDHPGTPYLHRDGKFNTPDGRGRFFPVRHVDPPELPDEEYPFYLTTGRVGVHWHTGSMSRRIHYLEREVPEPFVEINPEDARTLGVRTGDRIRVCSRRGCVEAKALVTDTVSRGVVFSTFHFEEAPINLLTINVLDPIALIPELKVSAVRIEKVERNA